MPKTTKRLILLAIILAIASLIVAFYSKSSLGVMSQECQVEAKELVSASDKVKLIQEEKSSYKEKLENKNLTAEEKASLEADLEAAENRETHQETEFKTQRDAYNTRCS